MIFTPPDVAAAMVQEADVSADDNLLVDFACGDGVLLRAARVAAPWLTLGGVDLIEPANEGREFEWIGGDFLVPATRRQVVDRWGQPNIVLLNPPFSRRSSRTVDVVLASGMPISVPPAVAFALYSCSLLADNGRLVCILPSSVDRGGWWGKLDKLAGTTGCVLESRRPMEVRFTGARVEVTLYRFCRPTDASVPPLDVEPGRRPKWTSVDLPPGIRRIGSGNARADMVKRGAYSSWPGAVKMPYVHTTHLGSEPCLPSFEVVGPQTRVLEGRTVVLPRVGALRPSGIQVLEGPIALSDCVHFAEPDDANEADSLRHWLRESVDEIARLSRATGAPYRTRADFAEVLWKWWLNKG